MTSESSSPQVQALKPRAARHAEAVIDALEDLLAHARAGRIECIAVAMVRPGGDMVTRYTQSDYVGARLGAVTILQHRLVQEANGD